MTSFLLANTLHYLFSVNVSNETTYTDWHNTQKHRNTFYMCLSHYIKALKGFQFISRIFVPVNGVRPAFASGPHRHLSALKAIYNIMLHQKLNKNIACAFQRPDNLKIHPTSQNEGLDCRFLLCQPFRQPIKVEIWVGLVQH